MTGSAKTDYSLNEMEVKHEYITTLYDLADELLATAESPFVSDPEAQLNLIEPVINAISDATDIMSEEFIAIVDDRRGGNKKANKTRIENSMRKIFNALYDYQERVKGGTKKTVGALKNIADPIIAKIQRHVEEVVVVFLEFVNLSLASIMQKQQLEAVRIRDPRIALMMHQHAMAQQQ